VRAEIERLGGTFHPRHEVTQFQLGGSGIDGVIVNTPEGDKVLTADHYISALPIEVMARLVTPAMAQVDPALAGLAELASDVRWMNGIQFYLKSDFRLNHGHTLHVDTPWALTSISQSQFWPDVPLRERGDGTFCPWLSQIGTNPA
jgi:hypothetical protein